MKIVSGLIAFLAIIVVVAFNSITRVTADWKLIQDVGGIKTGTPLLTEDGFYLPVVCNVSGLDSVTVKPATINSALSYVKTNVKVEGNNIYLKVIAGLSKSRQKDGNSKAVRIGSLNEGSYQVFYGDKGSTDYLIGQFKIER